MKPKYNRNIVSSSSALSLMLAFAGSASAQLEWDPSVAGNGTTGGSTTAATNEWTTGTNGVWWNGTANVVWAANSNANFAGTAGTVRLGSAISAGTLNFNTAGYTIDLNNFGNTAASNLTLTGLSGSAANIRNSNNLSTPSPATLNLSMAANTVWGGTIGSGGDRMVVNVAGGNSLTVASIIRGGGFAQTTLGITGTGTKLALSGTGSDYASNFVSVGAGATFDLGSNGNFTARLFDLNATGTITATGTARIVDNNNNNPSSLAGFLTGTLGVQQSENGTMTISNNGNTYSGGTFLTAGGINATANNALGTGQVDISNSSGTTTLNFTSAAPVIGSLASSNAGAKNVVLGTTGVNTTLTVGALNTSTTFSGAISNFTGRTGSLTKLGSGTLTLGGVNTYTGNTTVSAGGFTMGSTSEALFLLAAGNLSNQVTGAGTANFNGLFRINNSAITVPGVWNLVNVGTLTETFGGTFGLAFVGGPAFTTGNSGATYTSGDYSFSTSNGNLTLIPEPSTLLLGMLGGLCLVSRRRRQA